MEDSFMNQDFYIRIEQSVDAKIDLVPLAESHTSDPNGMDVMFAVQIGDQLVEAFTVHGYYVDDEAHLEVSRVNPIAFGRISGWINLG
jgi:hypothetical protein